MRLIDADRLINEFNEAQVEFDEYYKGLGRAKVITDNAPTVEDRTREVLSLQETIRKLTVEKPQGKWISIDDPNDPLDQLNRYKCSECGRIIKIYDGQTFADYLFCHCGAEMKGDTE